MPEPDDEEDADEFSGEEIAETPREAKENLEEFEKEMAKGLRRRPSERPKSLG